MIDITVPNSFFSKPQGDGSSSGRNSLANDKNALKISQLRKSQGEMNYYQKRVADIQRKKKDEQVKKDREYHRIFNQWRYYENLSTVLAMIGLGLGIGNFEYDITQNYPLPNPIAHDWDAMQEPAN